MKRVLSMWKLNLLVQPLVVLALCIVPAMAALNDTGVTLCFNGFTVVACNEIDSDVDAAYPFQDGRVGRDALAATDQLDKIGGGAAGFDFTPLDAAGNPIPLDAQGVPIADPVCVQDNVTGLLWQAVGLPGTYADATALAAVADFCGMSEGWRLPTRFELLSIVHHGVSNPAIDTHFFPNTSSWYYWSSDPSQTVNFRWAVSFNSGTTWGEEESRDHNLRLVRGAPLSPATSLGENEGTVFDNMTELMWSKCSIGQNNDAGCTGEADLYSWQGALQAAVLANEQGYLGYSDWRLPNRTELESLKDLSKGSPAINTDYFPNTQHFYWSSTSSSSASAWSVNFTGFFYNEGYLHSGDMYRFPVRLVRGGVGPVEFVPHPFAGGEGTQEDPYQIATAWQLDAVRNYLDKHFILMADIDLSEYADGEGWESIGDELAPFTGSLDGDGFKINNLFIDRPNLDGVGLFGATGVGAGDRLAAIENLEVEVDITGQSYVGGLVGDAREGVVVRNAHVFGSVHATEGRTGCLAGRAWGDSLIENVSTDCTVSAVVSRAGGMAGELEGQGKIVDSYALGDVFVQDNGEPGNYAGGLVGETEDDAQIHRSLASGRVIGARYVGGLVGRAENNTLIADSYAVGDVEGVEDVGGLVGDLRSSIARSFATGMVSSGGRAGGLVGFAQLNANITESYATGTVTGTSNTVGGLVGRLDGRVSSSFATGDVTGSGTVGGLVGDLWREDAAIEASYATGAGQWRKLCRRACR
jgi:hypothetical protein